ncbi:MAG: DUF2778 domain-containing protein [Pseudolabrys sp.]|jgi:hypothetical protein
MTYVTATFAGVSSYDGRVIAFDHRCIVFGPLALGLGGVVGACALVAAIVFAAASLTSAALSTNPAFHAHGSLMPATVAATGAHPRLAGTADFAGAAPLLTARARVADFVRAAELARAAPPPARPMAAAPVSSAPPAPPVESADNAPAPKASPPLPRARPSHEIAETLREQKATQLAELTPPPPAPAKIPPSGVLALPAKQPSRTAPPTRAPPQTTQPAKTEAKHEETAAPAAKPAALVTGSLPPPETSPKGLTVKDALAGTVSLPGPDSRTAIYDIAAHTVYMPDGKELEAHSGLHYRRDNPRYARQKMRGPTPPNIYKLSLREHLFHGVRAIRLKPVDENAMHGRDGMLAHTYMLGQTGQSFGCVSFKHYWRFLHAFLKGKVDRLVVVPRLKTRVTRRKSGHRYAFNAEN